LFETAFVEELAWRGSFLSGFAFIILLLYLARFRIATGFILPQTPFYFEM